MANVLFKRGSQEALETLKAAGQFVEGSFYLTKDTDRLYFAQAANELVELNKTIRTVATIADLPLTTVSDASVTVGDFYYIVGQSSAVENGAQASNGNILAICSNIDEDGKITWTQINPDTHGVLNNFTLSAQEIDNQIVLGSSLDFDGITKTSSLLKVNGTGMASISIVDGVLTIDATHYTPVEDKDVKLAADSGKFITGLKRDANGHVVGIETGSPEKVSVTPYVSTSTTYNETDKQVMVSTGVQINSSDNVSSAAIKIKAGTNIALSNDSETKTITIATDDVYNKTEVEEKISEAINASNVMVLKGEVNSATALPDTVEAGWAYLITEDGTYNNRTCVAGDVLVAKADTAEGVNNDYYYIPAGDDILAINGTTQGFNLLKKTGTALTTGEVNFISTDVSKSGGIVPKVLSLAQDGKIGSQVNVSMDMVWGEF